MRKAGERGQVTLGARGCSWVTLSDGSRGVDGLRTVLNACEGGGKKPGLKNGAEPDWTRVRLQPGRLPCPGSSEKTITKKEDDHKKEEERDRTGKGRWQGGSIEGGKENAQKKKAPGGRP